MKHLLPGGRLAALVLAAVLFGAPAGAAAPLVPAGTMASIAAALQMSADLGHGKKVSAAASAPGGPIVPEGCRNFGHWVSSEARGTTCADNPRPGRGPKN
ncbi:hypothetical protein [Ornithinimicrobium cerasi]|uniref:Uncharacterized protein n=1 Tax=Ornithinimicrobium cerasi TaxID=2248773 RepID=A0A285VDJ5_9MICO|nr:hypothetical protein [Ornithinimicrobium cerasi]SOC52027.1 hypothetical protein SAMN05421879_101389 [Ornithinimicrobium cerasi]